jgi:hypothetical protein
MRLNIIIAGILVAVASAPTLAQSDSAADNSMISKVDTVYVREANGLYIEKKLLRKTEHRELWVDVRFATTPVGEPNSELFKVPADIAIERGDLVAARFGDPTPRNMKLLPETNRVTGLVAKHDTLMAMTFGLSNSKRVQGLFSEAQACRSSTQVADAGAYPR